MEIDLPCSQVPRVSVIAVATSNLDLLRACLRSVARAAPRAIPFETIVVLNEAGGNAEAELRATVSGVHVTSALVNLGLAGAANRGRALARGELLILLHDDAEVEPGWMEALVQTADNHPEAGAVGGKVFHPNGRLQDAGMILWRDGSSSPPWVGEAPPPSAFDRLRAVDYCGTSSLLVRAAAWDAVGGLDERFYPVYCVDSDLSMALRRLSMVVLYQPRSRIRHHRGASTSFPFKTFVAQRNRLLFIEKWRTALEEYDPPERGSPVAIERALARAEDFASQCRQRQIPAIHPLANSIQFDPVLQERDHFEKNRALQNAYVTHLERRLQAIEGSSTWRATEPLRRAGERFPSAARLLRRAAKLAFSTFQLFGRYRSWYQNRLLVLRGREWKGKVFVICVLGQLGQP
jgi:GT2 family glycosyltransferase